MSNRVRMILKENPDLTYRFVADTLYAKQDIDRARYSLYKRKTKRG